MPEKLKLVYAGSRVEALFLFELLKENGIGSLMKKTFESSAQAGWAEGPTQDDAMLYVEPFNEEKAKAFLDEYFQSRDA
jgi:hypothetical protein